MTHFKSKYRIKSIRLKNWDYSKAGYYFVTICTKNAIPFFGKINNGVMSLSPVGKIAEKFWVDIPRHFKSVQIDEFVVMPNHIHGIIIITNNSIGTVNKVETRPAVETRDLASLHNNDNNNKFGPLKKKSLQAVIHTYKSALTRWCHKNRNYDFVWQSRFHDHIIRSEKSLFNIRQYIQQNPLKWEFDPENLSTPCRDARSRVSTTQQSPHDTKGNPS